MHTDYHHALLNGLNELIRFHCDELGVKKEYVAALLELKAIELRGGDFLELVTRWQAHGNAP